MLNLSSNETKQRATCGIYTGHAPRLIGVVEQLSKEAQPRATTRKRGVAAAAKVAVVGLLHQQYERRFAYLAIALDTRSRGLVATPRSERTDGVAVFTALYNGRKVSGLCQQ